MPSGVDGEPVVTVPHEYTSTACLHGMCGSCRLTCKYCDSPCQHGCHPESGERPAPWVDQARGIARELLDAALGSDFPPDLARRIGTDPDLFWLRDGEAPPGAGC